MALFDSLIAREAGQPTIPAVTGGSPGASRPASFVNPPGLTQGRVGRPPRPPSSFPGGAGSPLSVGSPGVPSGGLPGLPPGTGGGVPSPLPRPPAPPLGAGGGIPSVPRMIRPPAGGPGLPNGGGVPSPPQPMPGPGSGFGSAGPFVINVDRVPSRSELLSLPPGVQVQTPYGTIGQDGELQLSPEGQARYQQAHQARTTEYGPTPFAGDPNAPKPPVKLGKASVNPFTGKWLR